MLHALDATTARERWRADVGSYLSGPAVVDGRVYIGGDDGLLRALEDPAAP